MDNDRTLSLKTDTEGNLFGTTGSGGGRSIKWCLGPHGYYYFNGNNVGIGTNNPSEKLQVNGNMKLDNFYSNYYFGDTSWGFGGGSNGIRGTNTSNNYFTDIFGWFNDGNNRGFRVYNMTNNSVLFYVNSDGNVGIGTTVPAAKLEVNGNVLIKNADPENDTRTLQVGRQISNGNYNGIFLQDSPTWRGGKVGFAGGDGAHHSYQYHSSNPYVGCYIERNTNHMYIINGNDTSDHIYIDSQAGSVYTNSGWNHVSDDRLKHNEIIITNALNDIRQLVPKRYFKTRELYDGNHDFDLDGSGNPIAVDSSGNSINYKIESGLIAQEVYQIENFRDFVDPNTEKRFNEVHQQEDPWSIKYDNIFVHSIAALKELDAAHSQTKLELQAEKTKVATLETQLADVLARLAALESA